MSHAATAEPATRTLADLPEPKGLPVVGHAFSSPRDRVHQYIEGLARAHGPYFCLKFASRRVLVVADHVVIGQVLRARPDHFRRSSRFQQASREMGFKLGLFAAEGEVWHRQRRMVMASFAPQRIRAYFPALLNVTRRLQRRWEGAAAQEQAIDLQADLMRFTVDAITGLAFGHDVNTLEADGDVIQRHLDELFPALFRRIFAIVPYWRWFKLPADRRLDRAVHEVQSAIEGFIADARARMAREPERREHPGNLLEAFIVAAEQPGSGIGDHDVAGNVVTMLLAGEDTTANTLAWLIDLLFQNPQALARAREEVLRVAPRGVENFTPDTLDAMDYLEACAHEAMRLKPVAPFLPVEAVHDTVVGDVAVPAGTLIWTVLRHDSVSADHLPQPEAFQPERWLGSSAPVKGLATPFGSGPRICPGRYLALLEIKLAMAMLLSRFDILRVDTPDGLPAREVMAFTMGPDGLRMRLRTR